MPIIKKNKFMLFGIILLGVFLLGIPAVYAQDEQSVPGWEGSSSEAVDSNAAVEEGLEVYDPEDLDLVYTPISPCKIVDTRYGGGGFLPPDVRRDYKVYGDLGNQGGGYCESPVGPPRAVHISVTVVTPNGQGNLKVFPADPTNYGFSGLQVNFAPIGTNLANAGTVKCNEGNDPDISIKNTYAGSHVTIQVLGYYSKPEAKPLDRTIVQNSIALGPNSCQRTNALCPTGYEASGGGCTTGYSTNGDIFLTENQYGSGEYWWCGACNLTTNINTSVTAKVICVRVPGR